MPCPVVSVRVTTIQERPPLLAGGESLPWSLANSWASLLHVADADVVRKDEGREGQEKVNVFFPRRHGTGKCTVDIKEEVREF